ncbi:MAG: hypothetical protein M3Q56_06600 [Bacteroidota bacterium]|nr:hypothetical protein [Bacteroidota bacterium]
MKIRNWIILAGLVFLGLAIIIFRPVPVPDEKACLISNGIVVEIYEGGVKDIVFKLHGQNKLFYINRGLESRLDIKLLRDKLMNKEVTIKYPKDWTPLNWGSSVRHISKIEFDGRTIFTELIE